MAKKKTNNNKSVVTGNELVNLIKIIVIVCVVLLAFYFITVFINNKNNDTNNSGDTVATIQYEEIIVGEILNRKEQEYLVLVKKENDVNSDLYQSYLSIYSGKSNALPIYNVDLGSVFNANSIGKETILENGVADFKFNDSVLLKVTNGNITESSIGNEQIENYLKALIK